MISYGFCLGDGTVLYSSAEFSWAFSAAFGDGVCPWGNRFALTVKGMTATLASGYARVAGRWVKNDGPKELAVPPAWDYGDRADLVGAKVNVSAKKVEILVEPDGEALLDSPDFLPLYRLRVKRGATNLIPDDVTDLRRILPTLDKISAGGLGAYDFVTGGIGREVERILRLGDQILDKGDRAITALDQAIQAAGGMPKAGELTTARRMNPEAGWLLCDGGPIPAEYPELAALGLEALPSIQPKDPRLSTWIYGGKRAEIPENSEI